MRGDDDGEDHYEEAGDEDAEQQTRDSVDRRNPAKGQVVPGDVLSALTESRAFHSSKVALRSCSGNEVSDVGVAARAGR